ncbi:hypothetical protein ACH5A2_19695 [Streptomyces collinus]|uniref:hypothetical protein n=1 Tax=Streptomyces collinus TaxID=42684 RepID=UPI0037A1E144
MTQPCEQHPHAPTFDGLCGGCTQYPTDMVKPPGPAATGTTGYCPSCGRGDVAPSPEAYEQQRQRAEQAEAERDGAYRERAHLVALLAAMTDDAVITYAPDIEEPGWQIVYLTIGGQQCSWHIAPRDAELFEHVERVGALDVRALWDGHTTEEKYQHIAAHTAELAKGN